MADPSCAVGGYCASVGAASASMTFEECPGAHASCTLHSRTPLVPYPQSAPSARAAGTYNPEEGASSNSSCLRCEPGKANPVPGSSDASACVNCSPGTVAPNAGTGACDKCEAGSFQKEEGQTACEPCMPGSFCPEGASAPLSCAEGTHSDAIDLSSADQCTNAEPGHYATAGSTEPEPCSPGTAAPNSRMGACDMCEPGKYQDAPGQLSCSICGSGSYSANILSCETCQVDEFCPEGSTVGTPCPIGSTTEGRGAKRSSDKCGCKPGTYDDDPGDRISCTACNADMLCTNFGLTLAIVPLLPSRWRHSNRTADIYACDSASNTSACVGGDISDDKGTGYCADGHEGPRCEWCSDSNFYYDASSASCKDCGDVALYAFKQVVVLLAVIIALALLRLTLIRMPRLLARTSSRLAQLAVASQQFGLQAK